MPIRLAYLATGPHIRSTWQFRHSEGNRCMRCAWARRRKTILQPTAMKNSWLPPLMVWLAFGKDARRVCSRLAAHRHGGPYVGVTWSSASPWQGPISRGARRIALSPATASLRYAPSIKRCSSWRAGRIMSPLSSPGPTAPGASIHRPLWLSRCSTSTGARGSTAIPLRSWYGSRATPLTPEQSAALTRFALAQEGKPFALGRLLVQGTPFRCRIGLTATCSVTPISTAALDLFGIGGRRRGQCRPIDPTVYPANAMYPRDLAYEQTYDLSPVFEAPVLWVPHANAARRSEPMVIEPYRER